jgi:hypothetical protein
MERDKTNSVTHLVKIIAQEVVDEALKNVYERLCKLETYKAVNAGDFWNGFEDQTLTAQLDNFISSVAKIHGRTEGAIRARVKNYFNGLREE